MLRQTGVGPWLPGPVLRLWLLWLLVLWLLLHREQGPRDRVFLISRWTLHSPAPCPELMLHESKIYLGHLKSDARRLVSLCAIRAREEARDGGGGCCVAREKRLTRTMDAPYSVPRWAAVVLAGLQIVRGEVAAALAAGRAAACPRPVRRRCREGGAPCQCRSSLASLLYLRLGLRLR